MRIGKKKVEPGQLVLNIIFLVFMVMYIVPVLLCVAISFTDESTLVKEGYQLIPSVFSLDAYKSVFNDPTQMIKSYQVTIFFTGVSTALAILVMGLLAYPLSRSTFRGRSALNFYVVFTMLFSGGMVPSYILITKYLHLNDNILVYILPGLVSAYSVMIIRTNYAALPAELLEAAKIDGASELGICFRIVMPLCKPVLASIGFMFLVDKWNDWMTSVLYIRDLDLYSLQYLLQRILNEAEFLKQQAQDGAIGMEELQMIPTESFRYAMAVVAAGPVLLVFPFFQKYFTKGMTLGGVKG